MSSEEDTNGSNETIVVQKTCRGCLKNYGEMKDMFKSNLHIDFFKCTDIPREPSEGMPMVLCEECEIDLEKVRRFRDQCQESDVTLRRNLRKKANINETHKNHVSSILYSNKLIYMITAPNVESTITLQCPYAECKAGFTKKNSLHIHFKKNHSTENQLEIEQQFYCTDIDCIYNMNSQPNKYFTARKFLNQHHNNMHKDKIYTCERCNQTYSIETAYYRHLKTCDCVYECVFCQKRYNNSETYLVHLKRKHPNLHAKYKNNKKETKRLEKANAPTPPPESEPILISDLKTPKKRKEPNEIKHKKQKEVKVRKKKDSPKEKKIRKNAKNNKKSKAKPLSRYIKNRSSTNNNVEPEFNEGVPKEPAPLEITRFPPWELKMNGFGMPHIDLSQARVVQASDMETIPQVIEEIGQFPTPIDNETAVKVFEADIATALNNRSFDNIKVEECLMPEHYIEKEVEISFVKKENSTEEMVIEDVDVEMECLKKSSGTQIPEDISTNDISLPPWSNKVDFEIQTDDMSTQTVFEDLLSIKSQNEDDFFNESVSLSDIQTQTLPIDWLRCTTDKETQACTSQTPDLSIKETQTCFCLFDSKPNFKLFDSLSSSPASSNFISTETQTVDRVCDSHPVRSDVLLSFSSAETQTYFDDSSNGGINGSM